MIAMFPELKSERLNLSKIEKSDNAAVFSLFSDDAVTHYYDLATFETPEQADSLIQLFNSRYEAQLGIRWAIRLQAGGDLIGTCGFNVWSPKMQNAVIGYDLMPIHWGRGYAREAVSTILNLAFGGGLVCGPLHRIQADTVPGNHASESLLRNLGFKDEGLRREAGFWKGRFHDLKCFGLLKSEFKA